METKAGMQIQAGDWIGLEEVRNAIRADEAADRAFAAGLRNAVVESLRSCRAQGQLANRMLSAMRREFGGHQETGRRKE